MEKTSRLPIINWFQRLTFSQPYCPRLLDRIEGMTKVPDEVGLLLENRYFVTAAWRLVDTLRALEVGNGGLQDVKVRTQQRVQ